MSTIKETPIAMIGAGSWGTALAIALARNGQEVYLWGHNTQEMQNLRQDRINQKYLPGHHLPENIHIEVTLAKALAMTSDVFVVVPSHAFRDVLKKLKPHLHENARVAWGTKGLDPKTCLTLDEVAKEELGEAVSLAVLSGPSFAAEVAQALPTAVTVASQDERFASDLIERFRSQTFRLYKSKDMVGVELCGVYKNVLAIATGMSDGLHLGANARSALITRGMAELSRLITKAGGTKETLLGLAGVGDTILTCTTDVSRNRRFGLLLGSECTIEAAIQKVGQVVEGHKNALQLHLLAEKYAVEMPIAYQVYRVLHEHYPPQQAAHELLTRSGSDKWE